MKWSRRRKKKIVGVTYSAKGTLQVELDFFFGSRISSDPVGALNEKFSYGAEIE